MTRESLITFIKRILECGSSVKSAVSLNQLKEILEAQYAHGKPDFIAKLLIALKEANKTGFEEV